METWRKSLSFSIIMVILAGILLFIQDPGTGQDIMDTPLGKGVFQIEGNQDLLEKASDFGWNGSGNESDPIVIEGLDIDYPNGSMGLNITSTSLHVRIINCTFTEVARYNDGYSTTIGISIDDSANIDVERSRMQNTWGIPVYLNEVKKVEISNCELVGSEENYLLTLYESEDILVEDVDFSSNGRAFGTEVDYVENVTFRNCDFNLLQYGMFIYSGKKVSILNNSFEHVTTIGIGSDLSDDLIIRGNTIDANGTHPEIGPYSGWGIYIGYCERGTIADNEIESYRGITTAVASDLAIDGNDLKCLDRNLELYSCKDLTISENRMTGRGLYILDSRNEIDFKNNTLNGGGIFYRFGEDLKGIEIPRESNQVILEQVGNALISGLDISNINTPIMISESEGVDITDCSLSSFDNGIIISGSSRVRIGEVNMDLGDRGLQLMRTNESVIEDCFISTSRFPLTLTESNEVEIIDNRFESVDDGIVIDYSGQLTIIDNIIDARAPIRIVGDPHIAIDNNTFLGGRISFDDGYPGANMLEPSGNIQNGRPIRYIFHELDEIPTDGSYTLFFNISEKVIANHNFTGEVEFMECSSISLINISFRQTDRGLKLTECNGFEIVSMEAMGLLQKDGIFLDNCNDIYMEGSIITDCERGIVINRTSNAIISNSNISGNRGEGIRISNVSKNCRIEDSEISFNKGNGIDISSSNSITIIGNEIEMNKEYGVSISYSIGCKIHTNHFVRNNGITGDWEKGRSQAYSMHQDNQFHIQDPDMKQGNYWSDWNAPELDEDGDWIIDVPYEIESEEGASDQYPSLYRFDYVEEEEPYGINGDDWLIIIFAIIPLVIVIVILGFAIVITFGRRK